MDSTLRTRRASVILALAVAALVAACAPPPPAVHARPTGWTEVVLTRDGSDSFTLDGDDDALTLRADPTNTAGNTRIVAWQPDRAPSADNEACVTVDGWTWPAQEGIALRVTSQDGRTRAVTVTKNVWGHATTVFNVHVWDTSTPELFRLVASFDLAASLADGAGPQRLCGRTDGGAVDLKAWRSDAGRTGMGRPGREPFGHPPAGVDGARQARGLRGSCRARCVAVGDRGLAGRRHPTRADDHHVDLDDHHHATERRRRPPPRRSPPPCRSRRTERD